MGKRQGQTWLRLERPGKKASRDSGALGACPRSCLSTLVSQLGERKSRAGCWVALLLRPQALGRGLGKGLICLLVGALRQ